MPDSSSTATDHASEQAAQVMVAPRLLWFYIVLPCAVLSLVLAVLTLCQGQRVVPAHSACWVLLTVLGSTGIGLLLFVLT